MANKDVKVRLALVGGKDVRAELVQTGRDGAKAMGELQAGSKRLAPAIQNASYQIADFAVQVEAGTSVTRALGQQLPQVLGGLGVFGAVAGAAVAVLVPLVAKLFEGSDGFSKMADEALKSSGTIGSVEGAMSSLEGVQRQYNEAISATPGASDAATQVVLANSQAEFKARKEVLGVELELLRIRSQEQAKDLENLSASVKREGEAALGVFESQWAAVQRARDATGDFDFAGPTIRGLEDVNNTLNGFVEENSQASLAVRKLRAEQTLTNQTIERTQKLMSTDFADLTSSGSRFDKPARTGGASAAAKEQKQALADAKRLFDETRTPAEKYALEIARLNELLKEGAIDQDTYNRKAEALKTQFESAAAFAKSVSGTVKSSIDSLFGSIIEGGGEAGDAIQALGAKIAAMFAQRATYSLLGSIAPGLFGASGLVPLLNANGNAFDHGQVSAFADGGVVSGPTYFGMRKGVGLMGEAGPEAVMPLTRIGGKLGVLARGAGNQAPAAEVKVVPSEYFDVVVDQRAAAVSTKVSGTIAKSQQSGMAGYLANQRARGLG